MSQAPQAPRTLSIELRLQRPGLDIRAQLRALPGHVCALVGRPGSGKSALLKAAAGLEPALGGRVALGGDALYDSATRVNRPPHERRLAWLDAHGHLFPHLDVRGNLLYGRGGQRGWGWWRPSRSAAMDEVVAWLDLGTQLHHRPERLTPTQRLKVVLGRALLASPNALLLDDPLGQVPEAEREPLLDLLADLPRRFRLPVLLVSPRMNEVIRLADETVILHEGRMASAGPTAHILSDVSLSTFLEGQHAGCVLEGEVKRHDIEWLLSEVDVAGQRVTVPATLHPVGGQVRLKVRARDISLHRKPPEDTSVSNHLRGRIHQVMLAGGNHGTYGAVTVTLDRALGLDGASGAQAAPGPQVWAMLTRKAIEQMDWAPGQPCVLGFKAMATQVSAWR